LLSAATDEVDLFFNRGVGCLGKRQRQPAVLFDRDDATM
jgi:hypothetical protein